MAKMAVLVLNQTSVKTALDDCSGAIRLIHEHK
jgi:hypothetical protein